MKKLFIIVDEMKLLIYNNIRSFIIEAAKMNIAVDITWFGWYLFYNVCILDEIAKNICTYDYF